MAFTSAVMSAVRDYLKDIALQRFQIIYFDYDPSMTFARQAQEVVAKHAGEFARMYGHDRWLAVVYSRSPLKQATRRFPQAERLSADETTLSGFRGRVAEVELSFLFISPNVEYLEDLEEFFLAHDPSRTLTTSVELHGEPYEFEAALRYFEIQNFQHLEPLSEGRFSIFQAKGIVSYPVFVHEEDVGAARYVGVSVYCRTGEQDDVLVAEFQVDGESG